MFPHQQSQTGEHKIMEDRLAQNEMFVILLTCDQTTGFVLIPHIGVQRLTLLVGLVLIGTSLYGFFIRHRTMGAVAVVFTLVIGIFSLPKAVAMEGANPEQGLLAVEQSRYAEIRVVDREEGRYLLIDGGSHSAADTATWRSVIPYVNVIDLTKEYFAEPGSVLVIGLGGGSTVKSFAHDGWKVSAVEIDPVVTRMAQKYFGLKDDEAKIYPMDGRQFLTANRSTYEVVVMDAYGSSFIPFHLISEEAFGLLRSHLAGNGVLAVNLQCVGWHDQVVNSVAATLKKHFKHVLALPIAEPPDQFGNLVLFASDRPLDLGKEPPVPTDRFSPEYDRAHAWDNRFQPDTEGAQILTDDLNPVDTWSGRINFAARKLLHTSIDKQGIAW